MIRIKLPDICYTSIDNKIVILKNGGNGYYQLDYKETRTVKEMNELIGVDIRQQKAMKTGSSYGWNVDGANPNNYYINGKYKY